MRALLLVLDSVGIGGAADAAAYGDAGSNTLGHIFERVPDLQLPALNSLGLLELFDCAARARVKGPAESGPTPRYRASYGRMQERSAGKDTTTGHWEIAGAVLDEPFSVYDRFPDELVRAIENEADVSFLGNFARSGTVVLDELGTQHTETGRPILYTSADSVLQIAAHEEVISVSRLNEICAIARRHADAFRIGRVIARPFTGRAGQFQRTERRHDFSMRPPRTVLNALIENGVPVFGVGKISDIFAGEGIAKSFPTANNRQGMQQIAHLWESERAGLIFANLVDFDMLYGHRRDVQGYAEALRDFDRWLGEFLSKVDPEDLVIITADHGNDPTFRGSDHTREQVPLFVLHRGESRELGIRTTFADIAASLAASFQLPESWPLGSSFLSPEPI
ncbi:MAG: phosphopentomutase [Verrucomicrobiota bacterium]|nr:phosphopentomutase [Verrucomicrobiota bacterium]